MMTQSGDTVEKTPARPPESEAAPEDGAFHDRDAMFIEPDADEPVPIMQRILDNPFLLLFLGVVIPTVSYTLWGIMEVVQIPVAN